MKLRRVIRWARQSPVPFLILIVGVCSGCRDTSDEGSPPIEQGSPGTSALLNEDRLATHILGQQVENEDGEELGQVMEIAIDRLTGRAVYALISTGGTLGFGSEFRAVPVAALSSATTKVNTLALNFSRSQWGRTPLLKRRKLARDLGAYAIANRGTASAADGGGTLHPASAIGTNFQFASKMIGKRIVNHQEERLGTVSDLLIDMAGAYPSYAVSRTKRSHNEGETFLIALVALQRGENGALVLDAGPNAFGLAVQFDEKAWSENRAPNGPIYRVEKNVLITTNPRGS